MSWGLDGHVGPVDGVLAIVHHAYKKWNREMYSAGRKIHGEAAIIKRHDSDPCHRSYGDGRLSLWNKSY